MKTVLNVKTDKETKEQAQRLAKHLGIPLSTIVNAQLKAFVASGEFKVSREPELRPDVKAELERAIAEAKLGKNLSPAFTTIDEMEKWLTSEAE